ncbi:GldG family protein [Candidatus Sumerlaeota bacterium]|nr:GldG family protein [Candidatus Sumerlaeota bacterium]
MSNGKQTVSKILPILGIILVIAANIISAIHGSFTLATTIAIVVGLLLFLTIFLRFESANVRYYTNVGIYSLFGLGIAIFVYLLIGMYPQRWDITKQGLYSLSRQSKEFLKTLDKDVKVVAFVTERRPVEEFIKRYTYVNKKIKYEIYNPFKDTLVARKYDTSVMPGDIFVVCGKKKKKIRALKEKDFTNAIAEVAREEETVVYFLQGHGERSLEKSFQTLQERGDPSLSEIKRLLEERAISVKELKLAEKGFIPKDCSVLVCAGPSSDLFPFEVDILKEFLNNGGRAIFMLDPVSSPMTSFPNFTNLFKEFGVVIKRDIVVDMNPISQALYGDPLAPLVYGASDHPILKDLPKNKAFFVPQVRTVTKAESLPEGVSVEDILQTSDYSWAEDVDKIFRERKISQPPQDKIKPQTIAVAAVKKLGKNPSSATSEQGKRNEARLIVFGDSDMFANANISSASALVFLNGIRWLTEQKEIVAIPEKLIESTPVILSAAKTRIIFIMLVITLPSLVFFGGLGYTMLRRRAR